ncbi:MAG: hypothetical protein ACTTI3_06680 [Treponema sp.]
MEFDESRVYTALNADELKIGSMCYFADTVEELKELVYECKGFSKTELREIREGNEVFRFVDKIGHTSALAYLLLPPAEPKYKPFESVEKAMEAIRKHGGWVLSYTGYNNDEKFYSLITNISIGRLNQEGKKYEEIKINELWYTVKEFMDKYVFADDGSPCGELVEE